VAKTHARIFCNYPETPQTMFLKLAMLHEKYL